MWIGSNSLNSHSIKTIYFYPKTYCYYFVGLQQPPVSPPSPPFSLHFSHFLSPVTPVPNPPLHTGGTKINLLASFHLIWLYCKIIFDKCNVWSYRTHNNINIKKRNVEGIPHGVRFDDECKATPEARDSWTCVCKGIPYLREADFHKCNVWICTRMDHGVIIKKRHIKGPWHNVFIVPRWIQGSQKKIKTTTKWNDARRHTARK